MQTSAAGDRESFALLYRRHLSAVYRYLYLFSGSKYDSEEVVQDIFVSIWEQRAKLAGVRCFRAYLFRLAKNRMIDMIRRKQRERVLIPGHPNLPVPWSRPADDHLIYDQLRLQATQAISELPPRRKLIFELSSQEGLSLDEIARELKISKSVVKKQLYAAIGHLRKQLGTFEYLGLLLITVLNQPY